MQVLSSIIKTLNEETFFLKNYVKLSWRVCKDLYNEAQKALKLFCQLVLA